MNCYNYYKKSPVFFDGILGTRKIDPVDFELKEDSNPICSRPYPVPMVQKEMFKEEFVRLVQIEVLEV